MSKWSRSDVIGLLGLITATGSFCVALVVVPEFRQLLGLDRSSTSPSTTVQPSPSMTSAGRQPLPSATTPAIVPAAPVRLPEPNLLPTAPIQPTIMPTTQLETHRKRFASAPASWCQSVKDSRQFCEANNICIGSKEAHLLRLQENGCQ